MDVNDINNNELDDELIEDNNKKFNPNNNNNNNELSEKHLKKNDSNLTDSSTLTIDESILKNMESLGYKKEYIQKTLNNNELNYASATYYLLLNQTDVFN